MRHRRGRDSRARLFGPTRRDARRSAPITSVVAAAAAAAATLVIAHSQTQPGSSRNPHWKVEIGNKTAAIGRRRRPRGRMPNSIRRRASSLSLFLPPPCRSFSVFLSVSRHIETHIDSMDDVYDFPSRPVPLELAELKVKRDGGGCGAGGSKGVEGRECARLAGEKRASHEVRAFRVRLGWTGYA